MKKLNVKMLLLFPFILIGIVVSGGVVFGLAYHYSGLSEADDELVEIIEEIDNTTIEDVHMIDEVSYENELPEDELQVVQENSTEHNTTKTNYEFDRNDYMHTTWDDLSHDNIGTNVILNGFEVVLIEDYSIVIRKDHRYVRLYNFHEKFMLYDVITVYGEYSDTGMITDNEGYNHICHTVVVDKIINLETPIVDTDYMAKGIVDMLQFGSHIGINYYSEYVGDSQIKFIIRTDGRYNMDVESPDDLSLITVDGIPIHFELSLTEETRDWYYDNIKVFDKEYQELNPEWYKEIPYNEQQDLVATVNISSIERPETGYKDIVNMSIVDLEFY